MAVEIVVPRLGWSMDEGTFGEWLKRDGDFVERGQALFVLEGEKSAQDIESFDEGILKIPPDAPGPGDTVKVGQVLAFLVAKGESAPFEQPSKPPDRATPPSVATRAATASVAPAAVAHAANAGHPSEIGASPRARRLAAQLAIDWTTIRGTGRRGRVRERDVAALANRSAPAPVDQHVAGGAGRTLALSPLRRTIAARMSKAARETAPVMLTTRCDATNLVGLRSQFRAADTAAAVIVPSYNDLIVKLTAAALVRHPRLTTQWNDNELVVTVGTHIAIAVETEAGLFAPVVRDADKLTLRQVAAEIRKLAALAREGRLSADQMEGGVFTVTNLGMFGIDGFTPLVNLPQCAILGVGRISREPAVVNDQIVPRDQLTLSLTFDHRVVDGAPAARFLNDLRQAIEQPGAWLVP